MAEEINKDVNKKRRIPKLVVAVLLIVLLIGSLQVIHIVKFQVGKLSKQAQDDIEMKDFNEIIVSCRSEVVRDYGTHADGGISAIGRGMCL